VGRTRTIDITFTVPRPRPMQASQAAIHGMVARHGVTSYLPTTLAATPNSGGAPSPNARSRPTGPAPGVHIEATDLSMRRTAGRQLRDPDPHDTGPGATGAVRQDDRPERPGG
jgi:hypothetical protein